MKIVSDSPAYSVVKSMEKQIQGQSYDDKEEKVIVRFEKGIDFRTFDDFRKSFLGILNTESQEWGGRQMQRFKEMQMFGHVQDGSAESGIDIGIPTASINKEALEKAIAIS